MFHVNLPGCTPPKFNMATETWCLEDDRFLFGKAYFQRLGSFSRVYVEIVEVSDPEQSRWTECLWVPWYMPSPGIGTTWYMEPRLVIFNHFFVGWKRIHFSLNSICIYDSTTNMFFVGFPVVPEFPNRPIFQGFLLHPTTGVDAQGWLFTSLCAAIGTYGFSSRFTKSLANLLSATTDQWKA